jgi:hypothetical protein
MNNQPNVFFFEIQPISEDSLLFQKFQQEKIFFSYFQVHQKYYLFFYRRKSIEINPIESLISILDELDTKHRTIRSLRGFFRYALEIMDNGKVQFLETNLQPSFWRKLRKILKQNKKVVLLEFLFGSQQKSDFEEKIQNLETQVSSLQQKVLDLEAKFMTIELNFKYALSKPSQPLESSKTIQQGDSTLEGKKAPYLTENDSEVRDSTSRGKDMESKSFSDVPDIDFQTFSGSQQYNTSQIPKFKQISATQEKGLSEANFITLGRIPEEQKIEIIQTGFRLNQEGKISLKKYYESTDPNSLFQSKGYSIKYESIRRTKFYQNLKE